MSNPNDQLQLRRTAEPIQIQQQAEQFEQPEQQFAPQTVQQDLLQTGQAGPVERQQEVEQNLALQEQTRQQLPAAQAQQTAPGAPLQEQAPAKRSWKQRQKDKKHAKIARKNCPLGTAVTYDMATPLQALRQRQDQTMRDHSGATNGVDTRVLRTFSTGYALNKQGKPASPADAAAKDADDQFFADYCSKDVQRRAPHLERMVNELIAVQYTPDMLSEDNMRAHIVELKLLGDKMVYMENVMKDPVNKPFFDQLDQVRKDKLEAGFEKIFQPFVGALSARCDKNGVDYNRMAYYRDATPIKDGRMRDGVMQQLYRDSIGEYQQELADYRGKWVQRAAGDYADRMKQGKAALARIQNDPSLALGPEGLTSQYVTRSVTILKTGEGSDAENLQILQTSVQAGAVIKENSRPDMELYRRTRDLAAGRVNKVLDCDVDGLAALSDEELLLRAPELNALSMDSMFIDDLMKLNHPTQHWLSTQPMTLKDELVAQRGPEYAYKVSMLRGLAERARGLAMQRQGQGVPLSPEEYLTEAERQKLGDKDVAAFAAQREQLGARQIEGAREKYRAVTTSGTQENREWLFGIIQNSAHQRSVYNMKFEAVIDELEAAATPEMQSVMRRLKDKHYFSLAHTPEQLASMHLPQDISEAIFRSFTGFTSLRATEKMLSPEQYRTMMLQLGAGGDITDDSPAEARQAAIEQNAKGLATYKSVLRAQYDMLERKYGDQIEHLSYEDAAAHYTDMAKDFCDLQVNLNMATKFPGLFDPDDPEDVLLQQRIHYYGVIGNTALNRIMVEFVGGSEQDYQQGVQKDLRDEVCQQGREFLRKHHADFIRNAIDWKQDVRVPEGMGDGAGA
nr:hypothetical protein [uncultured Agathobaculum sp.]